MGFSSSALWAFGGVERAFVSHLRFFLCWGGFGMCVQGFFLATRLADLSDTLQGTGDTCLGGLSSRPSKSSTQNTI